jgi:23S rRNA pseudouridine1911/1915/1917 synthase
VQLAGMGCPIVGDVKYGFPRGNADGSILLHARALAFVHPVKKEPIQIEAPLPDTAYWRPFGK